MHLIQQYIVKHLQYLVLAISLVASAIVVIPFGTQIYIVGLLYIVCYALFNGSNNRFIGRHYILFLIACFLSCIASDSINYRLLAFIIIVISLTPITISTKLFFFRKTYLIHCLMVFPFLSIVSFYCYLYGINYYEQTANSLDFSAIFIHPMWMGAAIGLSNIVIIWLLCFTKSRFLQLLCIIVLLLSIYITIVSASRSAFFASIICMCIFLILKYRNIKKIILVGCVISLVTIILLPIYLTGSERMSRKFENSKGVYGSRTEIFINGYKHFKDTPIYGMGFSVSYNALGEKRIGRMESGSGWLSILYQTGLVGFSIMFLILWRIHKVFRYIWYDNELFLFLCVFMYLCLHSLFEGYILTVGYYPCILFWCLLGYLSTYPYYIEKKRQELLG